jgi:hypothetical protein
MYKLSSPFCVHILECGVSNARCMRFAPWCGVLTVGGGNENLPLGVVDVVLQQ